MTAFLPTRRAASLSPLAALALVALLLAPALLVVRPGSSPPGTAAFQTVPDLPDLTAPLRHRPPSADTPAPRGGGSPALAAAAPPSLDALRPLDASDEVQGLAAATGDAETAFAWVADHVHWTPSWGLRKSPRATLTTGEGNAFDQAQLLADVLRLQGTPAVVDVATVRLPLSDLRAWAGVSDLDTLARMLDENGVPFRIDGLHAEIEHAFVEARIGGSWRVLDPSFKRGTLPDAVDLAAALAELGYEDDLATLNPAEQLVYRSRMEPAILGMLVLLETRAHPDWELKRVLGHPRIAPVGGLVEPGWTLVGVHERGPTFPPSAEASVRFRFGAGGDYEVPTWKASDALITIVPEPASAQDAARVQRDDRLVGAGTMASLVLKVDGVPALVGPPREPHYDAESTFVVTVTFDEDRGADEVAVRTSSRHLTALVLSTGPVADVDAAAAFDDVAAAVEILEPLGRVGREASYGRYLDALGRASFAATQAARDGAWARRVAVVPSPSLFVVKTEALDEPRHAGSALPAVLTGTVGRDVVGAYGVFGDRESARAVRHASGTALREAYTGVLPWFQLAPNRVLVAAVPSVLDVSTRAGEAAGDPSRVVRSTHWPYSDGLRAWDAVFIEEGESFDAYVAERPDPRYEITSGGGAVAMAAGARRELRKWGEDPPGRDCTNEAVTVEWNREKQRVPFRNDKFRAGLARDLVSDLGGTAFEVGVKRPWRSGSDRYDPELRKSHTEQLVEPLDYSIGDALSDAVQGDPVQAAWNYLKQDHPRLSYKASVNVVKNGFDRPSSSFARERAQIETITEGTDWGLTFVPAVGLAGTFAIALVKETANSWLDSAAALAQEVGCELGLGEPPDDNLIVADPEILYRSSLGPLAREAELRQATSIASLIDALGDASTVVAASDRGFGSRQAALARVTTQLVDDADTIRAIPRVLLLQHGLWREMRALLAGEGIAVRLVDPYSSFDRLAPAQPLLVIPSGGLGDVAADVMAARLDAYTAAGGSILSYTQPTGRHLGILPGRPTGAGWTEDLSCRAGGTLATERHPALAGIDLDRPLVTVDGYFVTLPDHAKPLLVRTGSGQAAAALWPAGRGQVLASTLLPDYETSVSTGLGDDATAVRSAVLFLLHGQVTPADATTALTLEVPVLNAGSVAAATANVTTIGPRGEPRSVGSFPLVLAPGARGTLSFPWGAWTPGLYVFDVALEDAAGLTTLRRIEAGRVAAHHGRVEDRREGPLDMAIAGSQFPTFGGPATFAVHLWDRTGAPQEATVAAHLDGPGEPTEEQTRTVTIPASGHVEVIFEVPVVPYTGNAAFRATVTAKATVVSRHLNVAPLVPDLGFLAITPLTQGRGPGDLVPVYVNLSGADARLGDVRVTATVRSPDGTSRTFAETVPIVGWAATFRFDYPLGPSPSHLRFGITAKVESGDDIIAVTATTFEGPRPAVSIRASAPSIVTIGSAAQVQYILRNDGPRPSTGTFAARLDGVDVATRAVTLAANGGEESFTIAVPFANLPARSPALQVVYSDSVARASDTVRFPLNLTLHVTPNNATYRPGERVEASVRLVNDGVFAFWTNLSLPTVGGSIAPQAFRSVPGGESAAVFRFPFPTSTSDGVLDLNARATPGPTAHVVLRATALRVETVPASALPAGGSYTVELQNLNATPLLGELRVSVRSVDGTRDVLSQARAVTLAPGANPISLRLPDDLVTGPHVVRLEFVRGGSVEWRYADVLDVTGWTGGVTLDSAAGLRVRTTAELPAGSMVEYRVETGLDPALRGAAGRKLDVLVVATGDTNQNAQVQRLYASLLEAGFDLNISYAPVYDWAMPSVLGQGNLRPATLLPSPTRGIAAGADVDLASFPNPRGAWQPVVSSLVTSHPWRSGAERVIWIMAVSTAHTAKGSTGPLGAEDRALAEEAKERATAAGVKLVPFVGWSVSRGTALDALRVIAPVATYDAVTEKSALPPAIAPEAAYRDDKTTPHVLHRQSVPPGESFVIPTLPGLGWRRVVGEVRTSSGDLAGVVRSGAAVPRADGLTMSIAEGAPSVRLTANMTLANPAWASTQRRVTFFVDGSTWMDERVTFDAAGRALVDLKEPYTGSHLVVAVDLEYVGSHVLRDDDAPGLSVALGNLTLTGYRTDGRSPLPIVMSGQADHPTEVPVRMLAPVEASFIQLVRRLGSLPAAPPLEIPPGQHTARWDILGRETTSPLNVAASAPIAVVSGTAAAGAAATSLSLTLANSLSRAVDVGLELEIGGLGSVAKTARLPAGTSLHRFDDLPALQLAANTSILVRIDSDVAAPAEARIPLPAAPSWVVVERASAVVARAGDAAAVALTVRNSGVLPALATFAADAGSLGRAHDSAFVLPGATATLALSLPVGADVGPSNGTVRLTELGRERRVPLEVLGPDLRVVASLDRSAYADGDSATLRLALENRGGSPLDLVAETTYRGAGARERVELAAGASRTLELTVPVPTAGGRIGWSIFSAAGAALLIDNRLLPAAPPPFAIVTPVSGSDAGGIADILVRTPTPRDVRVESRALGFVGLFRTTVTGDHAEATARVPVPAGLPAGSYALTALDGQASTSASLDVRGARVAFRAVDVDRGTAAVRIVASQAVVARLVGDIDAAVALPKGESEHRFPLPLRAGEPWALGLDVRRDDGNFTRVDQRRGMASGDEPILDLVGANGTLAVSVHAPTATLVRLLVDDVEVANKSVAAGLSTVSFPRPAGTTLRVAMIEAGSARVAFELPADAPDPLLLRNGTARREGSSIAFEIEAVGPDPVVHVEINGTRHTLARVGSRAEGALYRAELGGLPASFEYRFGGRTGAIGDVGAKSFTSDGVTQPGGPDGEGPGDPQTPPADLPLAWIGLGALGVAAAAGGAFVLLRRRGLV